jgi:hypothetical protein
VPCGAHGNSKKETDDMTISFIENEFGIKRLSKRDPNRILNMNESIVMMIIRKMFFSIMEEEDKVMIL